VSVEIEVRPVGADNVADLEALFGGDRSTRHCWCTAFCTGGRQFAAGWFGGGNRRRFAELAAASVHPMGVLALLDDAPVGWCACGPRSRYTAAINGRSRLLRTRPRDEDDMVWLIACLFVDRGHRGRGITHALIAAAVSVARRGGAVAVEGWPVAAPASGAADLFLGREKVFRAQGFECVDRPNPHRSIMRLDLRPAER
jgi:GNAT superfamily N-acetyltransferase